MYLSCFHLPFSGAESEVTAAKQNAEQYQLAAQTNEEALRDLNLVITLLCFCESFVYVGI